MQNIIVSFDDLLPFYELITIINNRIVLQHSLIIHHGLLVFWFLHPLIQRGGSKKKKKNVNNRLIFLTMSTLQTERFRPLLFRCTHYA